MRNSPFAGTRTATVNGQKLLGNSPLGILRIAIPSRLALVVGVALSSGLSTLAASHYVSPRGNNAAPFTDWASAATNIQDAINVSSAGDVVWVTNGSYSNGGKVITGDLTNRVALDKALVVQSVNGPGATTIEGSWDPALINGTSSVRCVWLTRGAMLIGFTLRGGATRGSTSSLDSEHEGGGVYSDYIDSMLVNCVLTGNSAYKSGGGAAGVTLLNCNLSSNFAGNTPNYSYEAYGGGAYFCRLTNCVITRNIVLGNETGYGGGCYYCTLRSCALTQNWAPVSGGGGAYQGTLINCTVTGNSGYVGGGVSGSTLINCIVHSNLVSGFSSASNYSGANLTYCCSTPLPSGTGNITADPQLLSDGVHVAASSPVRGIGTSSVLAGSDIDGQSWSTPPSMGCDEWSPAPSIAVQPQAQVCGNPINLRLTCLAVGQDPMSLWWYKDGAVLDDGPHFTAAHTPSLLATGFAPADAGIYQAVASNAFGMVTSAVIQVTVHCVDSSSAAPGAPYSNWVTAATNIQDAIDAAGAGDFVLVTNGFYGTGGIAVVGDLTNRVALTKALTVTSINGANVTAILGKWHPITTNGPLAVRCAWLADGAALNGFALEGGATRSTGDYRTMQSGGGAWGISGGAMVVNCQISNNVAAYQGGGAYQGLLNRCVLTRNRSPYGGGTYQSVLSSCLVQSNAAALGGGAYGSSLQNCTVTANTASSQGGGIYGYTRSVRNSIVYGNNGGGEWAGPSGGFSYSCTSPLPTSGTGNINTDPQLIDGVHLWTMSPCRAAGNASYSSGTDIDGEVWANPPSIGCDEVFENGINGPLSVGLSSSLTTVVQSHFTSLLGKFTGRVSNLRWSFGDGILLTNSANSTFLYRWQSVGDYTVTFTAFNADYPAGVSTNLVVHVVPLAAPLIMAGSSEGQFSLRFSGQAGVFYEVQLATNLASPVLWQNIDSIYSTGGLMQVGYLYTTDGAQFYRLWAR